jgi:hypothetical protein
MGPVIRFERGRVLFLDFAGNFDGAAFCFTKSLIGSQVPDIIALRVESSMNEGLLCCGLQGLF